MKPIKVYKVVSVVKGQIYAPFALAPYGLSLENLEGAYLYDREKFKMPRPDASSEHLIIDAGMFHFVATKEKANELREMFADLDESLIIIECQIPPLTRYYNSFNQTSIAAKRFRVTKILQD